MKIHATLFLLSLIGVESEECVLFVDRSESGEASFHSTFAHRFEAPIDGWSEGTLDLHLFVDESSVEVFADRGAAVITAQIFPGPASKRLYLFGNEADLVVERLDVWRLRSIWVE